MGLLDEAIREHLDLKRRRGADPGEVERAEREALGPVRRVQSSENADVDEAADLEAMDFDDEAEAPEGIAFDHESEAPDGVAFDRGGAPGAAFDHESDDESWSYEHDAPEPEVDGPAAEPESRYTTEATPVDSVGQETAVHRPDFLDAEDFDEPDFEPEPPREPPAPHPAAGETEQYDVERHLGGSVPERSAGQDEAPGEGEELLEETPEFLQDTPDHDRLWFEQRPPKDFDFDG